MRDLGGDRRVGRRHDLRALAGVGDHPTAQVDLVAVVLRRVVRRRDHDPGVGVEVPDREGQHRRRQRRRQHQHLDADRRQHRRRVAGEVHGLVPGVVADDHARRGVHAVELAEQVVGQAGRGADDDRAVHPVRTAAEPAAQARGAELEQPGEPVRQLVAGRRPGVELLPLRRVGLAARRDRRGFGTGEVEQARGARPPSGDRGRRRSRSAPAPRGLPTRRRRSWAQRTQDDPHALP